MDWMALVKERGDVTTKLASEIPSILARTDLSAAAVGALFQAVHDHCNTVENLVSRMSEDPSVEDHLMNAAEALEDICDAIGEAVSTRLIEIRTGKRPVFNDEE